MTISGLKASWSNPCTAPTISRRSFATSDLGRVDGSKETRIAERVDHPDVLITGHPYVDIWQAVRPQVVGLETWPVIPKGTDWKTGIARAVGFSGEPGVLWKQILGRVSTYKDLEAPLVGAVESLIDFVTLGGPGGAADL